MKTKKQIRDKLKEVENSLQGWQMANSPIVQRKGGIMAGLLWVLDNPVDLLY